MNIKRLILENFGIFQNRKMEFGPGLNLVFGPNESGKTTLVDAIALCLLAHTDKKGAKLKNYPRALKTVKDRYGSDISLRMVVEQDAQELSFPAPQNFQDRWGVGWDELRAIFIAREGELELVKGEPREFRQWWDALKGKLLGFEEEPSQVLKKIAAEADLTPNLGLTRAHQERIKEARGKLGWYQENENNIRTLRALENTHRDLQLDEKRLIQEVDQAKKGLRKAKLIRAKEIYQRMKAAQQELLEKHGRYTEKDVQEWETLKAKLDKEGALLERLRQEKEQEEQKHEGAEAEAKQSIKKVATLAAKLRAVAEKEMDLHKGAQSELKDGGGRIPGWTPWMAWGLAVLSIILALAIEPKLFALGGIMALVAILFIYILRRDAEKREKIRHQQESFLRWGRELGLEASSLPELQQKIEGLRQEKARFTGQQAQLERHLKKTTDDLKSLTEQEKAKAAETDKIRAKIQALREKTGLGELEELQERVKSKNELQGNVEKKYKSELKVLLGPYEAAWPGALDELKALEDIQPVEDEKSVDKLNRALEICRLDQKAKNQEIAHMKAKIEAEFKVQKPEEVLWKVDDLRQELREMDILERAGHRVRQLFDRLLQKSDTILDDIIGGETVCGGFRRVTGGKYRSVTMSDMALRITDAGGETWDFQNLSTGTKDQLLTVLRMALAEKRLHDKGFLIFDDALVTSDRTRLREQMEMLGHLTQDGWQILFLTAQDEVRQEAERLVGMAAQVRILDL